MEEKECQLYGAAQMTHYLKETGNGSMREGIGTLGNSVSSTLVENNNDNFIKGLIVGIAIGATAIGTVISGVLVIKESWNKRKQTSELNEKKFIEETNDNCIDCCINNKNGVGVNNQYNLKQR